MTDQTRDTELLTAEEEAAEGWKAIDRRFISWHLRTCGVHTFKANRPECDCGLQAALDAVAPSAGALANPVAPLDVAQVEAALVAAEVLWPAFGTPNDYEAMQRTNRATAERVLAALRSAARPDTAGEPDDIQKARILDCAFDGVRGDNVGPRERAVLDTAGEPGEVT